MFNFSVCVFVSFAVIKCVLAISPSLVISIKHWKVHLGQPLLHALSVRAGSVFVKSTLSEAEHEATGLWGCFWFLYNPSSWTQSDLTALWDKTWLDGLYLALRNFWWLEVRVELDKMTQFTTWEEVAAWATQRPGDAYQRSLQKWKKQTFVQITDSWWMSLPSSCDSSADVRQMWLQIFWLNF